METTNKNDGFCACGCGRKTTVPKTNDLFHGVIAGVPRKFCKGHNANRRRHGQTYSPEHRAFRAARSRCHNPKDTSYRNYGGRGIKFLFSTFEEFVAELGRRPSATHSVDRINPDGHYEEGNIRWATKSEQRQNIRPGILKGRKPSPGAFKPGHNSYGKGIPRSAEVKAKISEKLKAAHKRHPGSWKRIPLNSF